MSRLPTDEYTLMSSKNNFQSCGARKRSVIGAIATKDAEKTFTTANVMHILPASSTGSLLGKLDFIYECGKSIEDFFVNDTYILFT